MHCGLVPQQHCETAATAKTRTNSELSTLRDSQDEVARRFQDEKSVLEEEVKRLKDQEENYTASAQFHQQDLRTQAEIASNAQQHYEEEHRKCHMHEHHDRPLEWIRRVETTRTHNLGWREEWLDRPR